MHIRRRSVLVCLFMLALILASTALAACGSTGATSGEPCTVYAVYMTNSRYVVGDPGPQVQGRLLLTKADVDPALVAVEPFPRPQPTQSGEYVVRVGYTRAAVQRAEQALPNPADQITVTWVFQGKVIQSGIQSGVSMLDKLGPFPSQAQAQHFATVITTGSCQGGQ